MPFVLSAVVVLLCLALLVFVVKLVVEKKLMLKYSLLWLLLAFVALLCAIFPDLLFDLSNTLGFGVASNFIFFLGFFFVLAILLSVTVALSKEKEQSKRLTQEVALLDERIRCLAAHQTDEGCRSDLEER